MSVTRIASFVAFVVVIIAVVVVEMIARRERSRIPTLGDLASFVMGFQMGRWPIGRIGVLGLWWWVGWHFFAR